MSVERALPSESKLPLILTCSDALLIEETADSHAASPPLSRHTTTALL